MNDELCITIDGFSPEVMLNIHNKANRPIVRLHSTNVIHNTVKMKREKFQVPM